MRLKTKAPLPAIQLAGGLIDRLIEGDLLTPLEEVAGKLFVGSI